MVHQPPFNQGFPGESQGSQTFGFILLLLKCPGHLSARAGKILRLQQADLKMTKALAWKAKAIGVCVCGGGTLLRGEYRGKAHPYETGTNCKNSDGKLRELSLWLAQGAD